MIIKHWHTAPIIKLETPKRFPPDTPKNCINRRVRAAREAISCHFGNASALLLTDIRNMLSGRTDANHSELQALAQEHIDHLWRNCIKEYAVLCTFTYLDSIQGKTSETTEKSSDSKSWESSLVDSFCNMAQKAITDYYEQKLWFAESILSAIIRVGDDFDAVKDQVILTFKKGGSRLGDIAHEARIQSSLEWLSLMGRSQYTYICDRGSNSCDACLSLDGKHFDVEEAASGVNLPPMHPNCRCTIAAFPELSFVDFSSILTDRWIGELERQMQERLENLEIAADFFFAEVYMLWMLFFLQAVKDCCGVFSTYEIDGTEYYIRYDSFGGVAYLPDGTFIKPENLKPLDEKMLNLMKLRDNIPSGDAQRLKIEQEIERLVEENKESMAKTGTRILSVSPSKPYSFYAFGGDITEQLYSYMHNTEEKYAYMHERTWFENLLEFARLVGNKREMDLKNQPEWQHSAFVFNGEIVDQDTLGNINYGFFGRHCNIPPAVLIAGAGSAQLAAGSSSPAFWFTLFDDPRDNDRVMQGIEIYEDLH